MPRIGKSLLLLVLLALSAPCWAAGADEDLDAIESLRAAGADLTQPQWLEFVFHFDDVERAQKAWNSLAGEGFRGGIKPAGGGKDYLVFARKLMLVEPGALAHLREHFEALAQANGGTYEGWGVP